MNRKYAVALLGLLLTISTLHAAEFGWMITLNSRHHGDPYGYRYDLIQRFGYPEPTVVYIINSVYEPADAYMIFRLAELSGRPPEYVLSVYRDRRFQRWDDLAFYLGINIDTYPYLSLRDGPDLPVVVYRSPERRLAPPPPPPPPFPPHHGGPRGFYP